MMADVENMEATQVRAEREVQTFWLVDGYDRSKTPVKRLYRWMSIGEAQMLGYGREVEFKGRDGTARRAKVNGMARTWKRDKDRVEVPLKYGMYEYTTLSNEYDGRVGNGVAYLIVRIG